MNKLYKLLLFTFVAFSLLNCDKENNTIINAPAGPGEYFGNQCNFVTDNFNLTSKSDLTIEQNAFYLNIWKEEMMKLNNISLNDFDKYFSKITFSSHNWRLGISFLVTYVYSEGWYLKRYQDSFIVKMNDSDSYKHHNIPRDVFLDKERIQYIIRNKVESSISQTKLNKKLFFTTCQDAEKAFLDSFNYPEVYSSIIDNSRHTPTFEPHLYKFAKTDSVKLRCTEAYLNLLTEKYSEREFYCGPVTTN